MAQTEYNWQRVRQAVKIIGARLEELKMKNELHGLIAIARGGLVPATMLSHHLDVPLAAVCYGTGIHPLSKSLAVKDLSKYAVIDEIADSLETYKHWRECFPASPFAVLVHKQPQAAPEIIHAFAVPLGLWVKFPWERPI